MQIKPYLVRFVLITTHILATGFISSTLHSQDVPTSTFSTLFGGSGTDDCDAIALDNFGNTYLGCHLNSPDLPGNEKYSYSLNASMDAFVVKLEGGTNSVDYIAHFGGGEWEAIQGLIADSSGNVFIVGVTYSNDLQVSSVSTQNSLSGDSDTFIAKIGPSGSVLWSRYFGGSGDEDSSDIVLDEVGNIHIVGSTSSSDLPTNDNSYQGELAGESDAFVATFDSEGKLKYVSYLGGAEEDVGTGIKVDESGRRYISGYTNSTDMPLVGALFRSSINDDNDAYIAVLNEQGNRIDFSTYIGGSGVDEAIDIEVSSSGDVIIAGTTSSIDLSTIGASQIRPGGGNDVFIARINVDEPALEYLSYFGGSGRDRVLKLVLDTDDNAVIVGDTPIPDFGYTHDLRSGDNEAIDGYIAIFDTLSSSKPYVILSGGSTVDTFEGVAIDVNGIITVTGASNSIDFPTKSPLQAEFAGGRLDILIVKFDLGL